MENTSKGNVRLVRRKAKCLKSLIATHKSLHLECFKLNRNLDQQSDLTSAELASFEEYYHNHKLDSKDTHRSGSSLKRRSSGDDKIDGASSKVRIIESSTSCPGALNARNSEIDAAATITNLLNGRSKPVSGKPKLPNETAEQILHDVVSSSNEKTNLEGKRNLQNEILLQNCIGSPTFKFPRIAPSVSSTDTTPLSTSPSKEEVFVNQVTDKQQIKSEPIGITSDGLLQTSDVQNHGGLQPSSDNLTDKAKARTCTREQSTEIVSTTLITEAEKEIKSSKSNSKLEELVKNVSISTVNAKFTKMLPAIVQLNTSHFLTDATILERVNELKTSGMLFAKRLPKVQEPSRPKTHWDYLLSEMVWMQVDFHQERLWKLNAARVMAHSCVKFLSVLNNPDETRTGSFELLPSNFIRKRKQCRLIASMISEFWRDTSQVLDIKNNLLEQKERAHKDLIEKEMDAPKSFSQESYLGALAGDTDCGFVTNENLRPVNTEHLDYDSIDESCGFMSQRSASSDTSHISLGIDQAELEKEIGHIMQMEDIFTETFNACEKNTGDKSPTAEAIPIGWHPTPGDHIAALEMQFIPVEKYAVEVLETVFPDSLFPWRDMSYENDEDILTIDREIAECEFSCVIDDDPMMTYYPPTPPIGNNDVYVDESMLYSYKSGVLKESQLPPIPSSPPRRSDEKKIKLDASVMNVSKMVISIAVPPPTLFSRNNNLNNSMKGCKLEVMERRSLGLPIPRPFLKSPHMPCKGKPVMQSMVNMDGLCQWLPNEEWALVNALLGMMQIPADLSLIMPAITPNWDFISHAVNALSRSFRSAKHVRNHYEKYVKAREEGRTVMTEVKKKQKANNTSGNDKNADGPGDSGTGSTWCKPTKLPKTHHLMMQDMNNSATYVFSSKFNLIRTACSKRSRSSTSVQWNSVATSKNPRHMQSFIDCKINYDSPLKPLYLSEQRVIRLKSEKRNQVNSSTSSLSAANKSSDSLFNASFTAAFKRGQQSSMVAPRGAGVLTAANSSIAVTQVPKTYSEVNTSNSTISVPLSISRQFPPQRKVATLPIQSQALNLNQQRGSSNSGGYSHVTSGQSSIRVLQAGETSSVAQKVTAEYQRMILSAKQREHANLQTQQQTAKSTSSQRISQVIHPGGQVVTQLQPHGGSSAASAGGSSMVYSMNSKSLANSRLNVSSSNISDATDNSLNVIGIKGAPPVQLASSNSKTLSSTQSSGRSSLSSQMYQNNGNQIVGMSNLQIRNIANSANNTVQLSSNPVANNIVKATTVVSRSIPAAASSTGTLMFSANRPQGGNPSTAAQLLGRQNLKKPSSNITFGLQGIRNSPVIVPATTQSCTGSQLHGSLGIAKNLSSIQQPMYSITPPEQASSNVSNIVHHAMVASKTSSQNSANSVQSSTAGRRSAFVQPLPSVASLQNFSSGARLVTSSSSFPKEGKSGHASNMDEESVRGKSGGSEMSNSFPF